MTSSDQDDELKDARRLYVNDGLIEQEERLNLIVQNESQSRIFYKFYCEFFCIECLPLSVLIWLMTS